MFLRGLSRSVFLASLAVALFAGGVAHADTIYVDDDAPAGGDGTTWTTAYASLQDALAVATSADEIRIAGGLYKPASKTQSFVLVSGAEVYGGFAGLADPNAPDARDIVAYATILSGDLLGNDNPNNLFSNRSDNCYHVVIASNTDDTTRLDGVTIEGGYAVAYYGQPNGGGVYMVNGNTEFVACEIRRNATYPGSVTPGTVTGDGAGVYCQGGAPTFNTCYIHHNRTGDGKSNYFQGRAASSAGRGAGLFFSSASPTLLDCEVSNNIAGKGGWGGSSPPTTGGRGGDGGGVFCVNVQNAEFTRCRMISNQAGAGGDGGQVGDGWGTGTPGGAGGEGGAVYSADSELALLHCQLQANRSGNGGEGGDGKGPGAAGGAGGAAGRGAGLLATGGAVYLVRCTCSANIAGNGGRGGDGGYDMEQWGAGGAGGAGGHGAAIAAPAGSTWLSANDCLLYSNVGGNGGGGGSGQPTGAAGAAGCGALYTEVPAYLYGCTIADNWSGTRNGQYDAGAGLRINRTAGGRGYLYNTVVWNNHGYGTTQTAQIYEHPDAVDHCCVQAWDGTWTGVGVIATDPLFADPNNADCHLSAGSPCIDAGNNTYVDPYALDLDGNDRRFDDPATADCPQGGCGTAPIVDMGCYEFGAPPADCNSNGIHDDLDPGICRGDANCDGQVDFADINAFVNAVVYGIYCDGTGLNADCARDCAVGFEDINPFVELLTTNTLPIVCP